MGTLFDREVRLVLSTQAKQIVFDQYDIEFDVFATSDSEPNTAKITIYGLSDAQRGLFGSGPQTVELYAGYKQDKTGLIFRGAWDPKESVVFHSRSGADWKTELEISDGSKEMNGAIFNKNYPAGTPLLKVLKDLSSSFGVAVVNELVGSESFLYPVAFCGYSAKILDDLAWSWKFDWSIQHGTMIITERGEPARGAGVVHVLDHTSGLVGEPKATLIPPANKKGKKAKNADRPGYEVATMMLSIVQPKSILQLQDKGLFQCFDIQYYGNNTVGEFNCNIKAVAL